MNECSRFKVRNLDNVDWNDMNSEEKANTAIMVCIWLGIVIFGTMIGGPIGFGLGIFIGRAAFRKSPYYDPANKNE